MKLNDNVVLKKSNGIEYLQFKKLLELGINHCYTLKSDNIDFLLVIPIKKKVCKKYVMQ